MDFDGRPVAEADTDTEARFIADSLDIAAANGPKALARELSSLRR